MRAHAAIGAILAILGTTPHPGGAARADAIVQSAGASDESSLARTVRNAGAGREAREAAADALVARSDEPGPRRELERLLIPGDIGLGVTLAALARAPVASADLLPALENLSARAPDAELPGVLRAAASLRSRAAAEFLLRFTDPSRSAGVRDAAFDALARLGGRSDLGADAARWREWLAGTRSMNESRWRAELIAGLARHADTLAADARSASGRVADALRRLYIATPPAERSGLLSAMLTDESAETRTLAFELASRELSASRRLDDSVGETALRLLGHPDALVRARAAALVNRLNPPGAEARVVAALGVETDAAAASAMILAVTRRPSPEGIDAVFRWLEKRDAAFGSAADATWTLLRAGHISGPDDESRVLGALRAATDDQLTASCCAILGAIGGDEGMARLARLLRAPSNTLRVAAADSLVLVPEFLDEILAAARGEPQLFDAAARAVTMHRPTAGAFRAVRALPAPSPDAQRRALLAIAAQLSATDLLEIARESGDDMALRESYLTLLASPSRILSERADPARLDAIAEGVILLAHTRIALDRPDGAVAALDALPELTDLVDHLRVSRLRALAMLCLNRLDDAIALDAPPGVWIDALERCINSDFAPALAAEIRARFDAELAPDEDARLSRLAALLPPVPAAPGDADFTGPPSPDK